MIFYLAFTTLCTIALVTAAHPCDSTHDCYDGLSCTIDFCNVKLRQCVNVGLNQKCPVNNRVTTSKELITSANQPQYSRNQFLAIINISIRILQDIHPHRLLHLNFLKFDPVISLKSLKHDLITRTVTLPTNVEFHSRMTRIFKGMHDRHTQYLQPPPFHDSSAFLPIVIRDYYDANETEPGYVVTDLANGLSFAKQSFGIGAKIITWNGEPIHSAIMREAEQGYGSNRDASVANAVHDISFHRLTVDTLPNDTSVKLGYISKRGVRDTVDVKWIFSTRAIELRTVTRPLTKSLRKHEERPQDYSMNQNVIGSLIETAMKTRKRISIPVNNSLNFFISAEIVPTSTGPIGRLSIISFSVEEQFMDLAKSEISRVIQLIPKDRLVVDIRGNLGGSGDLVRSVIEMLTSKSYEVPRDEIRVTNLTNSFVNAKDLPLSYEKDLRPFRPSMKTSFLTGNIYSGGTDAFNTPNRAPPVYNGSFVVLADGLTYSAGDLFVCIVKDNALAPIVTVGGNIGAGGSSVVHYSDLSENVPKLFPRLPKLVDLRLSLFRTLRCGRYRRVILENFGIEPDVKYRPTLRDRLENDKDLFHRLSIILKNANGWNQRFRNLDEINRRTN